MQLLREGHEKAVAALQRVSNSETFWSSKVYSLSFVADFILRYSSPDYPFESLRWMPVAWALALVSIGQGHAWCLRLILWTSVRPGSSLAARNDLSSLSKSWFFSSAASNESLSYFCCVAAFSSFIL